MATFTITSDDTLSLYDRVFSDFADGDTSSVAFPNNFVEAKTGKNKNTIFAKNEAGNNATLTLRLIRGSSDDEFMQRQIAAMEQDFVTTLLATGEFVKRLGDGQGNVKRDVYTMLGGMVQRKPDGRENVDGAIDQGIVTYIVVFANVSRSIQ